MELDPLILIAGTATALGGALIGNMLLIRKMSLISDSMPHIALPGIALGVLFNINPLIGAMVFLLLAVLIIWLTEFKTQLELDSIIGVLFVTSLALGTTLTGGEADLLEAFFGSVEKISRPEALATIVLSATVLGVAWLYRRQLIVSSFGGELVAPLGLNQKRIELLFLILVALIIAAGINFVGVLLMSSLLIVPSAAARNISNKSLKSFFITSGIIGAISTTTGLILTSEKIVSLEPGIVIVFISAGIFALSLVPGIRSRSN